MTPATDAADNRHQGPTTGLFGGTFNPIHVGHLQAARDVAEALGLGRVVFIPNATPPHKRELDAAATSPAEQIAPAEERLGWVEACAKRDPLFAVSRCEIDRDGPSYLVDTLAELVGPAPERFVFIVGQDAFREMGSWRAPRALFRACSWVVCTRPPLLEGRLDAWLPDIVRDEFDVSADGLHARHREAPTWIRLLEITPVDISASQLRELIAHDPDEAARWLPEAARDAILDSGCYTPGPAAAEAAGDPAPPSQEIPR
jgi:nicotinate-nucleotide adenylyltransferase